jgi:replicative DNA helicase
MDVPRHIEAEQALLGILLLDNAHLDTVNDYLKGEHFSNGLHGKIFDAILHLSEKGYVADPITLKDFFERDKVLDDVGGVSYLFELAQNVVSMQSVLDYGRIIYDAYLRRQLIHVGTVMIENACAALSKNEDDNAFNQIEKAEKMLYDLGTHGGAQTSAISFSDALKISIEMAERAFKRDGHIVGVTSGLKDLDRYLGGLQNSDLIILAGRPSMGKTALATNIAFNAALAHANGLFDGASVLFFSLEMSSEQLAGRILSSETNIQSDKIRKGEIRSEDFAKFVEVSQEIHKTPLFIDDTPGISISALRNRSRRMKRLHDIGLIVIDYLQLIDGSVKGAIESRVQEISNITRSLKGLAKELNIPVLALSQLSRAVEQRDDKRPQLSDLRESGSIEQDADIVMFVFREEYYEERKQPTPHTEKHLQWQRRMDGLHNKAEVIIAKQRHGPVGTVNLFFDGRFTRFGDLAHQ